MIDDVERARGSGGRVTGHGRWGDRERDAEDGGMKDERQWGEVNVVEEGGSAPRAEGLGRR